MKTLVRLMIVLSVCILFWAAASNVGAEETYVDIDNTTARRDEQNKIIDAHQGCLRFFDGKYYLYGTSYGNTNGDGETNRLVAYSSSDLVNWVNEGSILHYEKRAQYDRVHVVFHPTTHKYIAWFLRIVQQSLHFSVAQSDGPLGPFRIVDDDVKLAHRGAAGGDLAMLVDDDDQAYIAYTSEGETRVTIDTFKLTSPPTGQITYFQIFVERLSTDYLHGTGASVGPLAGNVDAYSGEDDRLFRRNVTGDSGEVAL
jgi:hypothetical protein